MPCEPSRVPIHFWYLKQERPQLLAGLLPVVRTARQRRIAGSRRRMMTVEVCNLLRDK